MNVPAPHLDHELSRSAVVFCQRVWKFALVAISTWALTVPGTGALAQAPPLDPDDPSPATRHAQVIAHGITAMPAEEVAWRLTLVRAVPPTRADAEEHPPGFILADKGVVALVDKNGKRLARIAPGEASWSEPGAAHAVIGLERKAPDYYDIALVPATALPADTAHVIGGAPFRAPAGDAFDIDLIRDVLNRHEESILATGPSPGLLLVTHGEVFVESPSTGLVAMTSGDAALVAGDVVVTGASRAPAAFVVARIGSEVPSSIAENATPEAPLVPRATPVKSAQSASIALSAALCPVAYTGMNVVVDCTVPASGVEFTLLINDAVTATAFANDDGDIALTGIEPGPSILSVARVADFAASRIRCSNTSGDDFAVRPVSNQIAMLLAAGDELTCTWYLVLNGESNELPPTSTAPADAVPDTETDSDGDGLTDALETTLGTDPLLLDSDTDAVSDSDEMHFYGTDALDADTDDDELTDAEELLTYGGNPLLADTDGDEVSDSEEIAAGSDLRDASSVPVTPTPIVTSTLEPTRVWEFDASPAPSGTPQLTPIGE